MLIFLSFFTSAKASVISGEAITAKKFNESTFGVGDIKHSLLTESQFQSQFGDCWVKMVGQCVSSSCGSVQSDYAQITGETNLPNAEGRFLRNTGTSTTGGNPVQLRALQEDEFKSHNHGVDILKADDDNATNYDNMVVDGDNTFGIHTFFSSYSGGTETRPKNVGVNYFLKINNACN
tara:strand:- start:103 stop:636 length:534 start_codon:yes stop_codon:yes gene_type:complete